jgi:hypothetical protein
MAFGENLTFLISFLPTSSAWAAVLTLKKSGGPCLSATSLDTAPQQHQNDLMGPSFWCKWFWILLPQHNSFALRDEPNDSCALWDAPSNKLGCRAETR